MTQAYDGNGNRTAQVDPEGNRTVFHYDLQNRPTAIIYADGEKTTYRYDEDGSLAAVCDAMGNEYFYTYDEMGRKLSERDPLGNVTKYTYCGEGKIQTITYPNGSRQEHIYDLEGRLIKVTKPDGTSTSFTYDKVGNILEETNSLGQKHRYCYDAINRLIESTAPNGGKRTFSYDAAGHVTKMVDERGNETEYTYSPNGNLIQVRDALGNQARYEYDCMNRLVKTERIGKNEENQVTAYEWNTAGRVIAMTDPLGNQETYSYDRNGMLQEKIDRDGCRTAYAYDKVKNLTDIFYQDGRKTTFSYNALRQLKEIEDWIGKTQIELDALGRPLSVKDSYGKTVQYRWGNVPRQTDMIYPDGTNLHYEYDKAGRLKELSDGIHTTAYVYNEEGKLAEKHLPNGIRTVYRYNELGRMESLTHVGDKLSKSCHFAYDISGNKIQTIHETDGKIDESRSFTYVYDAVNQLVSVNRKNQVLRTYAYDAFGNRIEKQEFTRDDIACTKYHYNVNNQLIQEECSNLPGMEKRYSYDGRGNLILVQQGNERWKQFEFNAANQLQDSLEVQNHRERAARYSYNGLGQRVAQEVFKENMAYVESCQHYLLDLTRGHHNLLESRDRVNGKEQRFFWDSDVVWMQEQEKESFYLKDVQGTVTDLTDNMGEITEHYDFDEFGIPFSGGYAAAEQPFGFAGYEMEPVGGMYFAHARRYDGNAGRFISEDQIRGAIAAPFTLNQYGYCWNRPVDLVDLDGRFPSWDDVEDWWNKYVYGEETVVSTTTQGTDGFSYREETDGVVTPSEKYTGNIIKKSITVDNEHIINKCSVNIPSVDFGDGWKWGMPISVGFTYGDGGVSLDSSMGIELGKINVNIPLSIGLSWEDLISVNLGINAAYAKESIGGNLGIGLSPFSNIKIGWNHKSVIGDLFTIRKGGVYTKTGYAYAVAVAVCLAFGVCTGTVDPSTAWNEFIQYIQSLVNGVCPIK